MGEEVRNKPPNPLKRAVEDKDNAVSFIDDSDEDDDSDSDDSDFNVSYQNKRRAYKVILNGKPEPVWIVEMTDTRSETVGWWLTRADFQIRYQRGDLLIGRDIDFQAALHELSQELSSSVTTRNRDKLGTRVH